MRGWWGLTRVAGYLLPLLVWPLFFRRDKLADFGLRVRGFRAHAWIYALCVVVMVPVLLLVSRQPDFADYYPMYKQAGRSWLDFVLLGDRSTSRSSSAWSCSSAASGCARCAASASGAIWSMVVPYCMIHYGKPYLEASAAIIAGVVLGLAGDAHAQHLRRLSGARDRRGADGHPRARAPPRPCRRC